MPDLVFVAASIILSSHLTREFAIVILVLHEFSVVQDTTTLLTASFERLPWNAIGNFFGMSETLDLPQ